MNTHLQLLSMTVYYPGYNYLFASTSDKQDVPYFIRLRKEYLRAVLQDLHDVFHHVYVLLENLTENRFAIVRYHDYVRSQMQRPSLDRDDAFTIPQFMQHYDLLHELDEFRVRFFTEVFYYEQSFTPHVLEIVYQHYLKYLCEQKLREHTPVSLTPESLREYGLTEADAKSVCACIEECNPSIAADVQVEYDVLSTFDSIEK